MKEKFNIFIEFLKKSEALDLFMIELNSGTLSESLPIFSELPEDFVISSFHWDKTKNGTAFWGNIDKLWRDYLKNIK